MNRKRSGSSRYFFFFMVLVVLIYGAYAGLNSLFRKLDLFKIESVVVSGNENLETEYLQNICNGFLGLNLYSIAKRDVLKKYENIVRIDHIRVSRIFPNKLKINISEKKGEFHFITESGEIFPLDKNRIVLDNVNFYENEILPVIGTNISDDKIVIGERINDPLVERVFAIKKKFDNVNPEFIESVSEFYMKKDNLMFVNANIGYKVVLGDDEIVSKLKKLIFLEQNRTFKKGSVIDLRFKDQFVVRSEDI